MCQLLPEPQEDQLRLSGTTHVPWHSSLPWNHGQRVLPTSGQGFFPFPAPLLALGLGSTTFEGHIWHPGWFKMAISTPPQNAGNASFSEYLALPPGAGRVPVGML